MSKSLSEYTKEELIELVQSLKRTKKFGLVWEDKPEKVATDCEQKLPVVAEVAERAITKADNAPTNLIIEGDNYHALSVLNYTHAGKIDVIYIDPPYNTGARDWRYNNDYVDGEDAFRHSKWLSFMSKRLLLAKSLLKSDGALICTIDKNEQANLGVLLRELFPDKEIVCITIVHNPGGIQGNNFSHTNEYAYFIYPTNGTYITTTVRDDVPPTAFRDWGKPTSLRTAAKTCFYPIFVKDDRIIGFGDVPDDNFHPTSSNVRQDDGSVAVYPVDDTGVERKWRFGRSTVDGIRDELLCKKTRGIYTIFRAKKDYRRKTVWTEKTLNANIYGTKLLGKIIGSEFSYPKSLYAVIECIKSIAHDKNNAIILDFFAGSGTTGHAVMEMNKEDGGTRQFIICTNNENKIAEEVTYPRIKSVIDGYGDTDGIPANVRYFKTDFVDKADTTDQTRVALVGRATDMIKIRENTFDKIAESDLYKIYENADIYSVMVFDPSVIEATKAEIAKLSPDKPVRIYIFSLANDDFGSDFADLDRQFQICPIPESILEVYKRIFGGKK